jgi:hypothetical protein
MVAAGGIEPQALGLCKQPHARNLRVRHFKLVEPNQTRVTYDAVITF